MDAKGALKLWFGVVLVSLAAYTGWASTQQPVWEWGGLTTPPDNVWTIATLIDAYYGFLTFYVWVLFKEARWSARGIWLVLIMGLGNMAMAVYVLIELFKLEPDEPASAILTKRHL